MADYQREVDILCLWKTIQSEVRSEIKNSPLLCDYLTDSILQQRSLEDGLCYVLAQKLADSPEKVTDWKHYLQSIIKQEAIASSGQFTIKQRAKRDLVCQLQNNASIKDHYSPLLFFAGYQALQCYRFAHYCWHNQQRVMASYIQAKCVTLFGVDIHPAARIGSGIFMDHSVAVVIGETAVVEDDVTLFQSVTLGGTGKGSGDRHPKVRRGAFIGSGAVIYGNIEIGENSKVAGGAVVVKDVAANTTVLGNTAKLKANKN